MASFSVVGDASKNQFLACELNTSKLNQPVAPRIAIISSYPLHKFQVHTVSRSCGTRGCNPVAPCTLSIVEKRYTLEGLKSLPSQCSERVKSNSKEMPFSVRKENPFVLQELSCRVLHSTLK